ncbi:MAG: hypothetical protein JW797_00230 [Bradymonadales bacterium]|nr:hypothetical protein [Bradymonadales bacterium]
MSQCTGKAWYQGVERLLLFAAALVPIWLCGPFPTYDGPQHAFAGYLLNHIDDPSLGFDGYLELQASYSALFAPVLTAFFEKLLPIRWATKCMVTVFVLLQAGGLLWLIEIMDCRRSPLRWFAPVFPYTYLFYMGFDNFSGGIGLGLCVLALMMRQVKGESAGKGAQWGGWVPVGGMLLLTALAHAFAACLVGLSMGLILAGGARGRRSARDLGRLLVVSLPALVVLGLVARSSAAHSLPIWGQLGWHLDSLWWLPRNLYETPYGFMWWANLVPLFGLSLLVRGLFFREPLARGFGLALLGLLGLMVLFPEDTRAWNQVPIRFAGLVAGLALVGGALGSGGEGRWRRWGSTLVLLLSLGSLVSVTWANFRLARVQREFESGIGQVESSGFRRFFFREGSPNPLRPDSYMAANLHVYYMIEEGCLFPFIFRNQPEAHLLRERPAFEELEAPFPWHVPRLPRAIQWQIQARIGLYYDEVLLWDPLRDQMQAFRDLGYLDLFSHGRLFRLAPANRTLRLRVTARMTSALEARIVFSDLLWPYARCALDRVAGKDHGVVHELIRLPACPVGLQVWEAQAGGRQLCNLRVDLTDSDGEVDLGPCLSAANFEVE